MFYLFFPITNLSFYASDTVTSESLIRDTIRVGKIKNIDPSPLPNFNVVVNKYLDTLLFEFDVLYCNYDYYSNAHNSKLFPTTLKNVVFLWFMRLRGISIRT